MRKEIPLERKIPAEWRISLSQKQVAFIRMNRFYPGEISSQHRGDLISTQGRSQQGGMIFLHSNDFSGLYHLVMGVS